MVLPDGIPHGTRSRRAKEKREHDAKHPNAGHNGGPKNSAPASTPHGGKKHKKKGKTVFDMEALNPPFDPRMRKIGSPLNQTAKIKRGWIQSADGDNQKVNFLFNPSQLDLSHSIDPSMVRSPEQAAQNSNDVMDPDYPTIGSSTGVKLLYDRTYELFSAPRSGKMGFANQYGVWADVAAWYVYLGLLPAYPESWEDSIITDPPVLKNSYLFIGPRLVFYGWVTGINVTYSHWNMQMVPSRCAIDVSFQILPGPGDTPLQGEKDVNLSGGLSSWLGDWNLSSEDIENITGGLSGGG